VKNYLAIVRQEERVKKKNKDLLNNISVGDFLHYCPADLDKSRHDIGIIYDIDHDKKVYHVYWAKTEMDDWFSATTLSRRLKETYNHRNIMKIIKQNE
jgi:hypothetical protein